MNNRVSPTLQIGLLALAGAAIAVPGFAQNPPAQPPPVTVVQPGGAGAKVVTSLPDRPGSGQVVRVAKAPQITQPPPAALQPVPVVQPASPDLVPELTIAGRTVMRLRATAGGLTPEERASSLRQRLGPILTMPNLSAADVTIRQERPGQTASIYIRDRLLITVDRNLAKANSTSVEGLAAQWARGLQETLPQINIAVRLFDPSAGSTTTAVR